MPLISIAALTILDAGPVGQIRAAAESGWQSVGLRLNPLLKTDTSVVGYADREAEILDLMAETKMQLLEIGVFPIKPTMHFEKIEPVLAFAKRLGARFVVCPVEDAEKPRRIKTFARLADLSAKHDLEALVEFNPYSACPSLIEAVDIVRASDRKNAGLVIDALHLSRSGGHPRDLAMVDPNLLKLLHFCDATPFTAGFKSVDDLRKESRTARLLPGEGALPLAELLAALPRTCPISVEAPSARLAGLSATQRALETRLATERFLKSL